MLLAESNHSGKSGRRAVLASLVAPSEKSAPLQAAQVFVCPLHSSRIRNGRFHHYRFENRSGLERDWAAPPPNLPPPDPGGRSGTRKEKECDQSSNQRGHPTVHGNLLSRGAYRPQRVLMLRFNRSHSGFLCGHRSGGCLTLARDEGHSRAHSHKKIIAIDFASFADAY